MASSVLGNDVLFVASITSINVCRPLTSLIIISLSIELTDQMATTTDYPRYYGNGSGRDSYIHANNGGLRNTSRAGDFRVHLRGGPPLLSDGSRLGV
jgi:hypothetical protein